MSDMARLYQPGAPRRAQPGRRAGDQRHRIAGWGPCGLCPWGGAEPRGIDSDAELRQLLVQAFARDAERDRGLRLVVAVLAQGLGDEPALDLLHHLLERALLGRDPRDRALDLAQPRRQVRDLDPVAGLGLDHEALD